MTLYRCHSCGYERKSKGMCPTCKKALESTCKACGHEKDHCICTDLIPQTKGPPRH